MICCLAALLLISFASSVVQQEGEPEWTASARVTAYCLQGTMRNGQYVHQGAAATDRSVIPEGSLIEIESLGTYISKDTGGAVNGWHIDVWEPSCTVARQIGNSYRMVRITRWGY